LLTDETGKKQDICPDFDRPGKSTGENILLSFPVRREIFYDRLIDRMSSVSTAD